MPGKQSTLQDSGLFQEPVGAGGRDEVPDTQYRHVANTPESGRCGEGALHFHLGVAVTLVEMCVHPLCPQVPADAWRPQHGSDDLRDVQHLQAARAGPGPRVALPS